MNDIAISKEQLELYLSQGMSSRQIEKQTGYKYYNILCLINKYGLASSNYYAKPLYNSEYFNKIDDKNKAYIIGFLLGDGCIESKNFSAAVALRDREILDFFSKEFGCHVTTSNIYNKETKRFPSAKIKVGNKQLLNDIKKLCGGEKKKDRHIPRIRKDLEPYLVQGFFDAEGCITWGRRKDRGYIWQKVSFTSQYWMLHGIQNILCANGITSSLRKKSKDDCYVIEICNKENVLKTLDYIYQDPSFIILQRKYDKAIALRRELGELGESHGG